MGSQAESISDMRTYMNTLGIIQSFDVEIPEEVKYCPYNGSYEQMIHKAMNDKNIPIVRSLIWYRDAMNKREKKIKEFQMLLQN